MFDLPIAGKTDIVRCHFLGLKMATWEDEDTAWAEHSKPQPNCQIVIEE